ncbi:hypothetical protein [Streptomyces albofaciens]|uniref:hypothetical protein n=1 Tax=Streptomyces albofaciens TaxID=66866 RepID=UPI000AC3AA5F|nr:hypothetical protein [Streptomyces albofaciens]
MRHRLGNLINRLVRRALALASRLGRRALALVNRLGRRELALLVIGAIISAMTAKLVDAVL